MEVWNLKRKNHACTSKVSVDPSGVLAHTSAYYSNPTKRSPDSTLHQAYMYLSLYILQCSGTTTSNIYCSFQGVVLYYSLVLSIK